MSTTFDPVTNFAYAIINGGITDVATTFSVVSGGSKFPNPSIDGAHNATIWNITDYTQAHLDPNAEIVRVTARSANTFTITRAQELTSAVAHNASGKTYAIALTFSKKTYDNFSSAINLRAELAGTNTWTGVNTFDQIKANKITAVGSGGITFEANNGDDVAIFGVGGGAGVTFYGALTVAGNLTVDTNTFFVNASTNRVGVGTVSPAAQYHQNFGNAGEYARWGDEPFTIGFRMSNPATSLTNGYNVLSMFANSTSTAAQGCIFITSIKSATEDTGSVAVHEFRAYRNAATSAEAVVTRPLFRWLNLTTGVMVLGAAGALTLGATAETGTGALFAGAGTFTGALTGTTGVLTGTNTTTNTLAVVGSSVTTGSVFFAYSNSSNNSSRYLTYIVNDHASATGTTALYVRNDSTNAVATFVGGATTNPAVYIGADALTTGSALSVNSNSASTSSFVLCAISNLNSSATGAIPLAIANLAPTATNFFRMMYLGGITVWKASGLTPNGSLSGGTGDICFGADSGKAYYCSSGTTWVAM